VPHHLIAALFLCPEIKPAKTKEVIEMAKLSGKSGKVMYGSVTVAEITRWSMDGVKMNTIRKDPAFGDSVAQYVTDGIVEPGTITFDGNYDPNDTAGQAALAAVCEAGNGLTNLYLYETANRFWRVKAGGEIIVTEANKVELPRTGIGRISFVCQVSGAALEAVG